MSQSNHPGDASAAQQRVASALVDVIFFTVIAIFGVKHVVGGEALVGLLSSYASARFGIAYGKQQTMVALSKGDGGGPPSGTGTSGQYNAVRPPPVPREDKPWQRRETFIDEPMSPFTSLFLRAARWPLAVLK